MAEIVTMPKLGFDMAEGTLIRWVVQEGEKISKGAVLAEIETDKATVEVESAYEGVVARHLVPQGEVVPVNDPIAVVSAPGEAVDYDQLLGETAAELSKPVEGVAGDEAEEPAVEQEEAPAPGGEQYPDGVKATPLARRMAEDRGIDLKQVKGSGPGGRITKSDIISYVPAATPAKETLPRMALPEVSRRETQAVPLNRLRAAIGRRMTEAKQQVPHFYITREYNMAALMDFRKQVNRLLPEEDKTSVNDFILKAVALSLREYPNLNASLAGDQVIRHGQVNVGVAVAVEGGLLTVVCQDTDLKSVRMISSEVRAMVTRARDGKVKPDDIEGSTFSVSNLGMFDVENFIAIINPPEAAILAVGAVREIPVVENGQVVPGMRMKATISVDHRVSDGAEAAQFMQALTKYLEEPLRLMV
jgi:pyruvate dehydrogenase E2 component (dihydrolipoamide acetyltransferase)